MSCLAAAPTGIAAANIEIDGTEVCAATLHNVFDLDSEYTLNLDFSKPGVEKVGAILKMKVLFLDEVRHVQPFILCGAWGGSTSVWSDELMDARSA